MARWAKLHDKVSESYDFAEAHRRDPNAALLFLLALPHADVYGILPGHPRLLHKVCALLDLTDEQISDAFAVLHDLGLVVCYEDSHERPLVCVVNYGTHQDVRWDRIAPPAHELPPGWTPPADLLATVKAKPECEVAAWLQRACGTTPGPLPDHSRLDTDTEEETEEETEETKGSAPAVADAAPKPQTKQRKPKDREADTPVQAVVRLAWEAHGYTSTPDGSGYAGLVKLVQAKGIPLAEEWATHVRGEEPELPEGADPWPWFTDRFRAALNRPWEWQVDGQAGGKRFYVETNGRKAWENEWEPDIASGIAEQTAAKNWNAKTGRPRKSVDGWACSDEHPHGKKPVSHDTLDLA